MRAVIPVIIGAIIAYLGYFVERTSFKYFNPSYEFYFLIGGIVAVAALILYLSYSKNFSLSFKEIFVWGIIFRASLLFISPNLSDDYYRFVWDGRLSAAGENPFTILPSEFIETEKAKELKLQGEVYDGFNSHDYYSVYPPVNQSVFFVSALLGGLNPYAEAIIIRIFILLGEIGSIWLLLQLLQAFKIPIKNALWYAWNPVIILEYTGNLHFESLMIFFMLLSFYLLVKQQLITSAIAWGAAISVKLIPLMFLPLFLKKLKFRNAVLFYTVAILFSAITFLPFWDIELFPNIKSSLDLYFGTFEFNAGIVYFIRWIGFETVGYDITFKVMPIVAKVIVVFIILYGLLYKPMKWQHLVKAVALCSFIYMALSATVHPWHVNMILPFALLAYWRFPIVWSFTVVLSYSAYFTADYHENNVLIAIQYISVLLFLIVETYGWIVSRKERKLQTVVQD